MASFLKDLIKEYNPSISSKDLPFIQALYEKGFKEGVNFSVKAISEGHVVIIKSLKEAMINYNNQKK